MFPDVEAHDRGFAFHYGAILVRRGDDVELASTFTSQAQPEPKRSGRRSALNFSLKPAKLPKVLPIASASSPDGLAAGIGSHDGPEHGVVSMAAAVVADGGMVLSER